MQLEAIMQTEEELCPLYIIYSGAYPVETIYYKMSVQSNGTHT